MTETRTTPTTKITSVPFEGKPIRLAWDQDHLVLSLDDLCTAIGAQIPTADAIDADVGDLYDLQVPTARSPSSRATSRT